MIHLRLFALAFALLWASNAFAQHPMTKKPAGDKVTLLVPNDFYALSPEQSVQRLLVSRPPLAAYQDGSGLITLTVNQRVDTTDRIGVRYKSETGKDAYDPSNRDIELTHKLYRSTIQGMADEVIFITDSTFTKGKRQYILLEFETYNVDYATSGEQVVYKSYNYVQYVLIGNRTVIVTFSAPVRMREKWEADVRTIMSSLKVK